MPPGQYLVAGFPVLSAGPTQNTPLDRWTFAITGEIDEPRHWTWEQLLALSSETITADIHCVTRWSKLDTRWTGVSVDTLLEGVETVAEFLVAHCEGGYTTNLPLEDVLDGKAWIVYEYDGAPLEPDASQRKTTARAMAGDRGGAGVHEEPRRCGRVAQDRNLDVVELAEGHPVEVCEDPLLA